VTSSWFFIRRL